MKASLKWLSATGLWVLSIWIIATIGFDYGPVVWVLLYLLVIAFCALLVYGVIHYKLIPRFAKWMVRDGK